MRIEIFCEEIEYCGANAKPLQLVIISKIEQSELAVEPIRADSVIFLESAEIILHIEKVKLKKEIKLP